MKTDAWNPQQYDKFKAQRSQPFYDLMNPVQPTANADVADLGCGTGELTKELHEHLQAKQTIGVDNSDEMLAKARSLESTHLHFTKGKIEDWKAKTSQDVIFSNAALQWCADHESLFRNLKDQLKPNGQLAIQMPMNHDYPTHLIAHEMANETLWKAKLKEPYDKQSYMLTAEQYATLLFKLGFKEQNVTLKVYGHELGDREGVIEWVKGSLLTYFESRLTEDDFAKFQTEFRKRLFERLPDDKPFFYPFKRILIWARN